MEIAGWLIQQPVSVVAAARMDNDRRGQLSAAQLDERSIRRVIYVGVEGRQRDHFRRAAAFPARQTRLSQSHREIRAPAHSVRVPQPLQRIQQSSAIIQSDMTGRSGLLTIRMNDGEGETVR